jgi:hypothetical protein
MSLFVTLLPFPSTILVAWMKVGLISKHCKPEGETMCHLRGNTVVVFPSFPFNSILSWIESQKSWNTWAWWAYAYLIGLSGDKWPKFKSTHGSSSLYQSLCLFVFQDTAPVLCIRVCVCLYFRTRLQFFVSESVFVCISGHGSSSLYQSLCLFLFQDTAPVLCIRVCVCLYFRKLSLPWIVRIWYSMNHVCWFVSKVQF